MGHVETQKENMQQEKDSKMDGVGMEEVEITECVVDVIKWDTCMKIVHSKMEEGDRKLHVFTVES